MMEEMRSFYDFFFSRKCNKYSRTLIPTVVCA